MTNEQVRTVLGDVPAATLGRVDYHEHLFQVSPLLVGDELTDETASLAEASALRQSGFSCMVDATPLGLGRNPAALARISRHTGMQIVAATGAHRPAHYSLDHWLLQASEAELIAAFQRDLTEGMPQTDGPAGTPAAGGPASAAVRAGVVKAASTTGRSPRSLGGC